MISIPRVSTEGKITYSKSILPPASLSLFRACSISLSTSSLLFFKAVLLDARGGMIGPVDKDIFKRLSVI